MEDNTYACCGVHLQGDHVHTPPPLHVAMSKSHKNPSLTHATPSPFLFSFLSPFSLAFTLPGDQMKPSGWFPSLAKTWTFNTPLIEIFQRTPPLNTLNCHLVKKTNYVNYNLILNLPLDNNSLIPHILHLS